MTEPNPKGYASDVACIADASSFFVFNLKVRYRLLSYPSISLLMYSFGEQPNSV